MIGQKVKPEKPKKSRDNLNKKKMKKLLLVFCLLGISVISFSKTETKGKDSFIIITPRMDIFTPPSGLTKNIVVEPNSVAYPDFYEVNLRVAVMVNTGEFGSFKIFNYRRVKGTLIWNSYTPIEAYPIEFGSTYSRTKKANYQLEGTEYEYRAKVEFTHGTEKVSRYTDIVTVKVKGISVPCFKMLNVKSSHYENSKYSPQKVNVICQNAVTIDGSCSKFENGYHIRISEFNLSSWTFISDLYNGWVAPGEAPPFISLNALAASNGKYFQADKLYLVGFSIGPVWKSADPQFFRIDTGCRIGEDLPLTDELSFEQEVNENLSDVKIYPNPSNEKITVTVNKEEKITSFTIFDTFGVVVKKEDGNASFTKELMINELKKGIYLLQVETDKNLYKEKLIKE